MKIVVLGSKGMLGSDVVQAFSNQKDHQVIEASGIDITQQESIEKLEKHKTDVIINCAAYTQVDDAEQQKDECYQVNAEGAKLIAEFCNKHNITLVHISTDYVFDGTQDHYNEDDKTKPVNWYGKSKDDGEKYIRSILKNHFIVRTSWLFGHTGSNFVNTVIEKTTQEASMQVVNDQIGCPTFTKDLAEALLSLITQNYKYGTYHVTNTQPCSWFEFAQEIIAIKEIKATIIPCTTQEFPRPAKRPVRSILANTKGPSMRSYKEALKEYIQK